VNELLAEVFSSKVRAAVLGHILPRPDQGFSLTELSRLLGLPVSSLQHECYKLERIGILYARRSGNARRYRVNPECLILVPLTELILTATGPAGALRRVLEDVPGLQAAFLTGSFAGTAVENEETKPLRLVLIGNIALDDLDPLLSRAEGSIGAQSGTIELAFFRPDDWQDRLAESNPYVLSLLNIPRVELVGDVPGGGADHRSGSASW
jgi:hypothetical protein